MNDAAKRKLVKIVKEIAAQGCDDSTAVVYHKDLSSTHYDPPRECRRCLPCRATKMLEALQINQIYSQEKP